MRRWLWQKWVFAGRTAVAKRLVPLGVVLLALGSTLHAEDQVMLDVRFLSVREAVWETLGLEPTSEVTPVIDEGEVVLERAHIGSGEQAIQMLDGFRAIRMPGSPRLSASGFAFTD